MKGIVRKTKESAGDFMKGGDMFDPRQQGVWENDQGYFIVWKVEYEKLLPHAGISKKGTGPGVGKKTYITKSIPLHLDDISMVTENMEVEFEIDGSFAVLSTITWDDVRDFMLSGNGLGDINDSFKWVIEEFKKRNYKIPEKVVEQIKKVKK